MPAYRTKNEIANSVGMQLKRPMLAAPTKEEDLRVLFDLHGPMLCSLKLDGVRALCRRNPETGEPELVSRTLKRIPNVYTQQLFALEEFVGLDGELCVGAPNDKNVMQATTSGVMSRDGEPDVRWYVFDRWDSEDVYALRAKSARSVVGWEYSPPEERAQWLSQFVVGSYDELVAHEDAAIAEGYEGLILRHPRGLYKQGRSTLKQAWMLKVKRFEDSEAEVLGVTELMHNGNELERDERGYAKRSTHKDGMQAAGMLGALQVRDIHTGVEFDIGTGFTEEQRINLWKGRRYLIGKLVKYKSFAIGVKDKPRFPVFLGFRSRQDV